MNSVIHFGRPRNNFGNLKLKMRMSQLLCLAIVFGIIRLSMVVAKPPNEQEVKSYEIYYRATPHPTSTIKPLDVEDAYGDDGDGDPPFVYHNVL